MLSWIDLTGKVKQVSKSGFFGWNSLADWDVSLNLKEKKVKLHFKPYNLGILKFQKVINLTL